MRVTRHATSLHASTEGSAIVETAVVVPFLIFLMVGVVDFGLAYSSVAEGQKSIRAAARYLSKLPISQLCDASGGQLRAKQLALYGNPDATSGTTRIKDWAKTDITITLTPPCSTPPAADTKINVSAGVPYRALAFRALGFDGDLNIGIEHEERWLGQ